MKTDHYKFLKVEVRDHVCFVTFNSPETGNTWADADAWEMTDVVVQIRADDDVRAVVLTGAGDTFGGGAHHSDDPFDDGPWYDRANKRFGDWIAIEKPIVVALNGKGNLTLVLLSDIVVAERHVTLEDRHVLVGVPAATGSYLWPQSVGLNKSKRYILTGDGISAEEAERMGLIAEVVDTGKSVERATELAMKIAALDPTGVQQSKKAINKWMQNAFDPILRHGLSLEFLNFPLEKLGYPTAAPKS